MGEHLNKLENSCQSHSWTTRVLIVYPRAQGSLDGLQTLGEFCEVLSELVAVVNNKRAILDVWAFSVSCTNGGALWAAIRVIAL